MDSHEIRRSFLDFFAARGHRVVPSSSLVPADDPTLLFTNAGMNQFKDVFLGKERRDYVRAASAQKCMRVSGKHNDLEHVGPSLRHHTFFEMLGNFSFGDYFKADAIAFAWELLTDVWKLEPDRLYATVFGGGDGIPRDEDAYRLWQRFLPDSRITELGAADNFWAMGETGPCGRCSEIHYFRGDHLPCPEPVCLGVACECDRFVEVWNNVFMEFDRGADDTLRPLPAPSIDTGMGLERVTAVLQRKLSNYDTDLFVPILRAIGAIAGVTYGPLARTPSTAAADVHMRVIADHIRAATFLIADGVLPSNEWRGYVLRKILRRAMRHGKKLHIREPFLHRLVDVVVREMGAAYPELPAHHRMITEVVRNEEERFSTVLEQTLPQLEALVAAAAADGRPLAGDEVFRLYDTFGLPVDFIEDLAGQQGVSLDREAFERAMEEQRKRARARSAFDGARPEAFELSPETRHAMEAAGDRFDGYTATTVSDLRVLALFDDRRREVTELAKSASGYIVLDRTPFYLEAGGQVSDRGTIHTDGATAIVESLVRIEPSLPRAHRVRVTRGLFRWGDQATAEVDRGLRDATRRNHTATHLLHAALRETLGPHVKQAGSLVAPDRLRFDFVHFAPLSSEEIERIERMVNEQVYRNAPVQTDIRPTQEAIAAGAMALFGEKYGDHVRVVTIPGFSVELCGGTHCAATGDIGPFVIVQEGGISAGVRRIEALTGEAAVRYLQEQRARLRSMLEALNVGADQGTDAIRRLQENAKRLAREASQLKLRLAMGGGAAGGVDADMFSVGDVQIIARRVEGLDRAGMRSLADSLRDRLARGIVILGASNGSKASIVVSVTPNLRDRAPAGQIVKELAPLVGGGGGGRADFAEAGGRAPEKLDAMLAESRAVIERLLASRP